MTTRPVPAALEEWTAASRRAAADYRRHPFRFDGPGTCEVCAGPCGATKRRCVGCWNRRADKPGQRQADPRKDAP